MKAFWRTLIASSLLFNVVSPGLVLAAEIPETEESTISPQAEDIPVIDPASLTISPKIANVGDMLTISLSVTNDLYVGLVVVDYREPGDHFFQTHYLHKSWETGLYETTFEVTEEMYEGEWTVEKIYTTNGNGQMTDVYTHENATYYTPANLSGGHFTIPDITAPAIDASSLTLSKREGTGGETISLSVSASDKGGVKEVLARYLDPKTGLEKVIPFVWNWNTNFL